MKRLKAFGRLCLCLLNQWGELIEDQQKAKREFMIQHPECGYKLTSWMIW